MEWCRLTKRLICLLLLLCVFAVSCAKDAEQSESAELSGVSEPELSDTESGAESEPEQLPLPRTEAEVKRYRTGEEQSAQVEVAEYITAENFRGIVGGTCPEGAEVFAVLRSKVIGHAASSHGTFILELPLPQSESLLEVKLYCSEEQKSVSEPVAIKMHSYATGEYPAPGVVWVGKDGWLFFNNTEKQFTNNEDISQRMRSRVVSRTKQRVEALAQSGTELIYVLIPNPNELYPQEMPDGIEQGTVCLREQAAEALREGGATVIDLGPALKAQLGNTNHELYHHTDSHWTEYAAYFAYKAICDEFAKRFPAASARDISEFGFAEEFREAGDLYYDLGMQKHLLRFRSTFSDVTFTTPVDRLKYAHEEATVINNDNMDQMDFTNPDGEGKPSFLMLRDSYSIMLFDWLAERASVSHFKPLWEFEISAEEAAALGVDYIIVFVCDMNLNSVLR